jgi:hypothetical protein
MFSLASVGTQAGQAEINVASLFPEHPPAEQDPTHYFFPIIFPFL